MTTIPTSATCAARGDQECLGYGACHEAGQCVRAVTAQDNPVNPAQFRHIMIDLETLGTTADAVILSIGAVRFDLDSGTVAYPHGQQGFYQVLDIDDQLQKHQRRISASTLAWWMTQPREAQAVFTDEWPKAGLYGAMSNLGTWISQGAAPLVWSNGADFDLPMLVHAYTQADLPLPWAAYAGRCYRTYKNLPGARGVKVLRQGQHHNALDDAVYQAQHLCAIHAALFDKEVVA